MTSLYFLRHQIPALGAIGRTALRAVRHQIQRPHSLPLLPGPRYSERLPPRDPELVQAFLSHLGSRPGTWEGLPPHFFPQWTFAPLERSLRSLPYPPLAVLNGGCKLVVHGTLPSDEPLDVDVQLTDVDERDGLAIITQKVTTGTPSSPQALEISFSPVVPLKKAKGDQKKKAPKDRPTIPEGATLRARWDLVPRDGLDFALLTGDFNPIHWLRPAAQLSGFQATILHGFASMGRAIEVLVDGEGQRLREIEVRFNRPLVLPAEVGLYVDGDAIYVGEGPGSRPYMSGHVRLD